MTNQAAAHPPARDWRRENVLVTGATGFIGSHLVAALLTEGASVHALVCERDPRSMLVQSGDVDRINVIEGRLEQLDVVRSAIVRHEVTTVFHLGAQTIVGAALRDPLGTFESNVRGTYHLLEACRTTGALVRRIVVATSDKVYGETGDTACTERAGLAGGLPYEASKACADLIAQSYAATYALPVAILRCSNVYGPGDLNFSRVVPSVLRDLLAGRRPVLRSDGTPVRDYLYVADAVRGYLALAAWLDDPRTASAADRAFNFCSGAPLTVLELVARLRRIVHRTDLEPRLERAAVGEIQDQRLDATRARTELSWQPSALLDTALATTAQWYRTLFGGRIEHDARPLVELECEAAP